MLACSTFQRQRASPPAISYKSTPNISSNSSCWLKVASPHSPPECSDEAIEPALKAAALHNQPLNVLAVS
jgi:hypothetical protein